MGLATKIKLGVAVAAVLIIAGLTLWAQALRADRARLGAELGQARTEVQSLKRETAANVAALAQRTAEQARLREETAAMKKELEALYEKDEEARAWAGGCLPGGLVDRLR